MSNILDAAAFTGLTPNTAITCQVCVGEASTALTKNNSEYLKGTFITKTGPVPFKMWGSNLDALPEGIGSVYTMTGKVDEYNGAKSIVVSSFSTDNVTATKVDFLEMRYDLPKVEATFLKVMKDNLSPEGFDYFQTLFMPLRDRFVEEFAARMGGKNHDNVYGGLLAHSMKCLVTLDRTLELYPTLVERCDTDLLYIGVGLHDIGKVLEYSEGNMSPLGNLVSHRSLAIELIARKKKHTIGLMGEDFYYRLMAIFAQHHGEYEEKPRTIEALIVHYVDNYEAQMAALNQTFDGVAEGDTLWHHGFYIS